MRMAPAATRLNPRIVLLLAVACGAAVANLYYAQPLLDTIGRALGVSGGAAGLLVTLTQVGYAAGIVFVVPLGDRTERRGLVTRMLLVAAGGLALAAAAPSFAVLGAALMLTGLASVVAQVLVPFASSLAADFERGRVVGRVMSGLLLGILLGRAFSGLVAELGGWRVVYAAAAVGMVALAALLRRSLPVTEPPSGEPYPELLRSVLTLVREEPVLRRRMLSGALLFAGFSVLWTAVAFLLAGPPYDYGDAAIGALSLAGLAGAAAATFAGRLADAGHARASRVGFLAAVLAGWGLLALGGHSLAALVAGTVVLDLGVQGGHILNQNAIYALDEEARSRLTTAYITAYFAGGALGSAGAALAWSSGGWGAVCALGAAVAAVGLAVR